MPARVLRRQRSLSRGKTGSGVDVEASKKSLRKGKRAKKAAELGKAEADQALQAKSKPKSKARPKFKEELEQESLEKDTPGSSSAEPSLAALEKAAWEKRVKDQAKEFARSKKAKVCVDWHNTLEKGGSSCMLCLHLLLCEEQMEGAGGEKGGPSLGKGHGTRLSLSLVFLI